jgi:hypothetical protein
MLLGIKGYSFITTIEIHHLRSCLERGFSQCSSYHMLIFKYVGSQYFILENQVIVHAFHQKSWLYYMRRGVFFIFNWIELFEIGLYINLLFKKIAFYVLFNASPKSLLGNRVIIMVLI